MVKVDYYSTLQAEKGNTVRSEANEIYCRRSRKQSTDARHAIKNPFCMFTNNDHFW